MPRITIEQQITEITTAQTRIEKRRNLLEQNNAEISTATAPDNTDHHYKLQLRSVTP